MIKGVRNKGRSKQCPYANNHSPTYRKEAAEQEVGFLGSTQRGGRVA